MIIVPHGKTEFDPMKSKIDSFGNLPKEKKSSNLGIILIIIIIFFIFILLNFSIIISNKKIKFLQNLIQQKDVEIENLKVQLNKFKNEKLKKEGINSTKKEETEEGLNLLDKEYLFDKNFYQKHNMGTETSLNKLGYESIMLAHSIEKGIEHFNLRPFGIEETGRIINLIKSESKYENYKNSFAYINGINSLREYKYAYEVNDWTDKDEYKKVRDFLKDYKDVEKQKTGAFILTKKELENDYKINYLKFLKSRHSTRNYRNEQIKLDDVKLAVEIAKYSASACNRQYIKLHFYPSGKMRDNVIQYAIGKGGLYLQGVNTFLITFDVNGLVGPGERNQGYFNAGLFSTNLINAFHSLGIGSCFIQFSNSVKDEEDLKSMNEIPVYERIAVILFAGYYDEKSIFAVSPRKDLKEILLVHT